jgi:hypothetical protein
VEALTTQSWFTFHSDELSINSIQIFVSETLEIIIDEIHFDFQRTFVHLHTSDTFKEVLLAL